MLPGAVLRIGYNVTVNRVLAVLVVLLVLASGGIARGEGSARQLPLPCGLPQAAPLWVDYADGQVPFWSTIFARPASSAPHPARSSRRSCAHAAQRRSSSTCT